MSFIATIALFVAWTSSLAAAATAQPWLDTALAFEERLQSFIAQLNATQKLAMVQGDTVVCSPLL